MLLRMKVAQTTYEEDDSISLLAAIDPSRMKAECLAIVAAFRE